VDEKKNEILINELLQYAEDAHERNKKRIDVGLKCLCIIPVVLLILMFTVTSNRMAFLVLWIGSVLIITGALIGIEYSDYKLQMKLNEFREERNEIESLTADQMHFVGRRVRKIHEDLDEMFKIPENDEEDET
jgi:uncharacterized protein involved in cysteine biosynthesis